MNKIERMQARANELFAMMKDLGPLKARAIVETASRLQARIYELQGRPGAQAAMAIHAAAFTPPEPKCALCGGTGHTASHRPWSDTGFGSMVIEVEFKDAAFMPLDETK